MRDLARFLNPARLTFGDVSAAKQAWASFREAHGLSGTAVPLLTAPDGNYKLGKTGEWSLALAPSDTCGVVNVCRYSTPECRKGCVSFAGKGVFDRVQKARQVRTLFLFDQPHHFVTLLDAEITRAKRNGPIRMRLNAFSDIPWETVCPQLFERHADVHFYDYTKWGVRLGRTPANYRLTYSCSEKTSDVTVGTLCRDGENVAVVFSTKRGEELPRKFLGVRVIDGDKSDNRFDDPKGVIVGLRAKGAMRKGTWRFVKEVA